MESDDYRARFVELGGIPKLVQQLGAAPDPSLNWADVQLEAVLNLQDIIENEDGTVIGAFARKAQSAGAEERLRKLRSSEDDEVRGAAEEVLISLEKVRDGGG